MNTERDGIWTLVGRISHQKCKKIDRHKKKEAQEAAAAAD